MSMVIFILYSTLINGDIYLILTMQHKTMLQATRGTMQRRLVLSLCVYGNTYLFLCKSVCMSIERKLELSHNNNEAESPICGTAMRAVYIYLYMFALAVDKTVSPMSIRCQGNNACAAPFIERGYRRFMRAKWVCTASVCVCVYMYLCMECVDVYVIVAKQIIILLFTFHFPCSHSCLLLVYVNGFFFILFISDVWLPFSLSLCLSTSLRYLLFSIHFVWFFAFIKLYTIFV